MPGGEISPMEFGELKANVHALMESDRDKAQVLQVLATAVQKMEVTLAEARGGWKTFVGIGTAFFTAGATVWEFLRHMFK